MCGITGFFDPDRRAGDDESTATVLRMADTLEHRGPDDRGAWADAEAGLALGFRRLAIVDLSAEGHQPMVSASGRYVLAFNGEVYNHADLRRELIASGAAPFRGQSDTEVMLAAFERWGPDRALERFVGMFAFALWDRRERILRLARDRIGEKPLYYGWAGGALVFGSELKALRAYPGFSGEVDREALALYMRLGYVPAPHSIYLGIGKLPPGTSLTIDAGRTVTAGTLPAPVPYWSARHAAEVGAAAPFVGTEAEATDRLETLLREAVGLQMVADVPLGAFLSGGIDSSTIVALMQAQSPRPVKTFTIGFEEAGYDEARYAKEVARHLGTDHTELYVTPAEAREVIPSLPTLYDEPFSGPSAIPTYLVARMARRQVTVSLSGDGGDELFGGYSWYPRTVQVWDKVRRLPRALRRTTAGALAAVEARRPRISNGEGRLARFVSPDRVGRLADLLAACARGGGRPLGLALAVGRPPAGRPRDGRGAPRPAGLGGASGPGGRPTPAHADRHADVSAGRHPRQGRPGEHGGQPRGAGAVPGPSGGRVRPPGPDGDEDPRRPRQMAAPPGPVPPRPPRADRAAEDGLHRAGRSLAPRPAAGMGGGTARREPAETRGIPRPEADPEAVGRAPLGSTRPGGRPLVAPDVPGLARIMVRGYPLMTPSSFPSLTPAASGVESIRYRCDRVAGAIDARFTVNHGEHRRGGSR